LRESKPREKEFAPKLRTGALSAAFGIYERTKRLAAPLEPDVEYLHTASGDRNWNESFYFNFADPKRVLGGWTRIGILPNQEGDLGAMLIYAGGSRVLATLQGGRTVAEDDLISLGTLDYHRMEPLLKWRIIFEGRMVDVDDSRRLPELDLDNLRTQEVEVDLSFEGTSPCFNYKHFHPRAMAEMLCGARTRLRDLRLLSKISSHHYEQAGGVSGTIRIGNRDIIFQGSGHRDHSWGTRDWAAPRLWTWLTCQFGEELAFNLSRVCVASADILNGFTARDGEVYRLRRAALQTEFEDDGMTQRDLTLLLQDSGGEVIEISGRALTVAPLRLESEGKVTLINEALTEYRWGDRIGYGISEYLHQLGDER
jgi:hypothetical protein